MKRASFHRSPLWPFSWLAVAVAPIGTAGRVLASGSWSFSPSSEELGEVRGCFCCLSLSPPYVIVDLDLDLPRHRGDVTSSRPNTRERSTRAACFRTSAAAGEGELDRCNPAAAAAAAQQGHSEQALDPH